MAYLVLHNFHVFAQAADGKDGPRTEYKRGMVIQASEIPAGHSAESFVERGLVQDTAAPVAAPVALDDAP